jgi:hypothetical protein
MVSEAKVLISGQGLSPFQIKLRVFISWTRFKVYASNDVHDSTLFNFF